ncbi:PQQ-dependent dehydrogenase, methanol/ethanol family [Sphingobium sp. EM0848]|uniref:PQQ-dependent dehydrogenase, methanol/ethanol family n=1 Tax=Sphingobium sp. EM0848 TaxID=2743473 RepID=UPI00159BF3D1|nr:PQQ-dependent dehydrogenase, methanol/ethanol family [Sphingobium sp. EM0848]
MSRLSVKRGGLVAVAILGAMGALLLRGGGAATTSTAQQVMLAAMAKGDQWVTTGGTYEEQRFGRQTQINPDTISRLKLAWYADLNSTRGQESTPLVVDGVMYVTTAWNKLVALEAETGRQIWAFDPKLSPAKAAIACCDVISRGAAYYDGMIFAAVIDGRLIGLDARTGKQIWSVQTTDPNQPYSISGAPRAFNGKVIIGNGGADVGVRGYVTAYDAKTGKKLWRFYTIPGNPAKDGDGEVSDRPLRELAQKTWFGRYWDHGGGGTAWDSIVYDPDFNQLYIGVGNGGPWNRKLRSQDKGDNLFLSSIVAVDADTGEYKWHYQETPGESWDFTATQQITLADLTIDGKPRKVLMQAPKNGFFYILDRQTGKLLSAKNYVPVNWASHVDMKTGRPVENPEARYRDGKSFISMPGSAGGHNWFPMSYNPGTGLVYIPAQEIPFLYKDDAKFVYRPALMNYGVDLTATAVPNDPAGQKAANAALKGYLLAWDPVRQKEVWRVDHPTTWNGGVLSTAGNLVFQGTRQGSFQAFDARNGRKLWSFPAQTGLQAGPVSYEIKGRQYIAIVAGDGGGANALPDFDGGYSQPDGRVLVFALDGKAALPPFTPARAPLALTKEKWPSDVVANGSRLFANVCSMCHGAGGYSKGVLPDLRRSGALPDRATWKAIVHDGALADSGMKSFAPWMSVDDVESIRAYVQSQAQAAARNGQQ